MCRTATGVDGQGEMSCNAVLAAWLVHVQALWEDLEGPAAAHWQAMLLEWPALHRKLVARRCRLPADLQHIFGIRPRAGAAPIMASVLPAGT